MCTQIVANGFRRAEQDLMPRTRSRDTHARLKRTWRVEERFSINPAGSVSCARVKATCGCGIGKNRIRCMHRSAFHENPLYCLVFMDSEYTLLQIQRCCIVRQISSKTVDNHVSPTSILERCLKSMFSTIKRAGCSCLRRSRT